MSNNWSFETRQIHSGQQPDPVTGARALPIYQTTSFVFPNAESAAARFALQELEPIYTRIGNPTQEAVENRIADLEGGVGALLLASGQAATTLAILNSAEAGDHVVASPSLYGGTQNLFKHTLRKLGIEVTFVADPDNLDQWRAAVKPNTKAFFGEVVSNPRQDILDIEGVSQIAHEAGVPLLVDNTLATPYLIRPIEWGADIVIHSATKYLGGHGTAIAGVIVDSGNFDFAKDPERFPDFNTPDESYNGLVFARDLGVDGILGANLAYILKARVQLLRDLGSAVCTVQRIPHRSRSGDFGLRIERHVQNAKEGSRPGWKAKSRLKRSPTLACLPRRGLNAASKYSPNGVGAIIAFEIAGGVEAGKAFVDALELHSHVANLGDVRSLVIHPASTTHAQLTEDERLAAGVRPGLVRLSVGLKNIKDILADLQLGFAATAQLASQELQETL